MSPLKEGDVLSEEEYDAMQEKYGYGSFVAEMGAEAVKKALHGLDLEKIRKSLNK